MLAVFLLTKAVTVKPDGGTLAFRWRSVKDGSKKALGLLGPAVELSSMMCPPHPLCDQRSKG